MQDNSTKLDEEKTEPIESKKSAYYTSKHHRHEDRTISKLFWGLLFILIGVLVLASNFGMINLDWSNLWRLWPLFIITTGLSILSVHHVIWKIVLAFVTFLMLAAIAWVLIGYSPNSNFTHTDKISIQKISSNIQQAEINIKAGAGSININTLDQPETAKASLKSSIANLIETSTINNNIQRINLSLDDNNNWWKGNVENSLDVNLTRNLPMSLNIDAGASNMNIDLSQAQLLASNIKFGASNLVLKLGTKQDSMAINIEAGASSITVRIPINSGVQLTLDGGLLSRHLADLTKIDDNTFKSPNYQDSSNKINITSKIGVSSFTIERY